MIRAIDRDIPLDRMEGYWRRRQARSVLWALLVIVLTTLTQIWLWSLFAEISFFSLQLCLLPLLLTWQSVDRLRHLRAGFAISRESRDARRWSVLASEAGLVVRCPAGTVSVARGRIHSASCVFEIDPDGLDQQITDVLTVYVSPPSSAPAPEATSSYRTEPAGQPTAEGLRCVRIPATATGFPEAFCWLAAEVPLTRHEWSG
jgi:hypothetical protein